MPLHLAARGGHRKACEMLYEHGAPHLAKNKAGKRPQDLAREQPNSEAHRQVVAYFDELKNIFRTGGGSGNALEEALAHDETVKRVDWMNRGIIRVQLGRLW